MQNALYFTAKMCYNNRKYHPKEEIMKIRKTHPADLDEVMLIYREAREFMINTGNPTQWWDGYPPRALIEQDIAEGDSFVVEEDGQILAVFLYKEKLTKLKYVGYALGLASIILLNL